LKTLHLLPLLVVLAGSGACAPIKPWVKPYEREHLAARVMKWDRDPIASSYLAHVRENREGARGATGTTGGGCGCN
jgi:hypothetical protein